MQVKKRPCKAWSCESEQKPLSAQVISIDQGTTDPDFVEWMRLIAESTGTSLYVLSSSDCRPSAMPSLLKDVGRVDDSALQHASVHQP